MAKDDKKSTEEPKKRGQIAKGGSKPGAKPKRGLNKIPSWLRNEVGLHDWIASSVVIIGGGLTMCLVVWILSVVWPG